MTFKRLNFGTAGIPISTLDRNTINGIKRVEELGLSCMEIEFVRSVNIKEENTLPIKETAKKYNINLTCHGQYYINLASLEKPKIHASINRVLNVARIANLCGAKSLTFHAGFYMKRDKEEVYSIIRKYIKEILDKLEQENNPIMIRPETTGKATQWGDIGEIIQLSKEFNKVMPCIDFSHLHARSGGKFNTYAEFSNVLKKIKDDLGNSALSNMHCHVSGIAYSEKGEKNHLTLKESDFNYKALIKALKEYNCKGIIISESPNIEQDALLMKQEYDNLN